MVIGLVGGGPWLAAGCTLKDSGTGGVAQPGPSSANADAGNPPALVYDAASDGYLAAPDADRADVPGASGARAGTACTSAAPCASGFCVDGLCCDSACAGSCEACDVEGHRGRCTPVTGAPRAGRTPCLGAGSICGGICAGSSGACHYPDGATECSAARCTGGMAEGRSVCSGAGSCLPPTAVSCAPFTCDGPICAGGCGPGRPCQAGNHCTGGRCFLLRENGAVCDQGDQCASSQCVDGHCCTAAACGVCGACTGPGGTCQMVTSAPDPDSCAGDQSCGADGQCHKTNGQDCQANGDCLSGFCIAGRCCNSACSGPCESCALPAAVGTCQPIPLASDVKNCGRCGNPCSDNHITPVCDQGTCGGRCQPGFGDCNADPGKDGCETNTAVDPKNCGACANPCPGTSCIDGACEKIQFEWSAAGVIPGKICVPIGEVADPFTWDDNFLCTQRDFGLRWSSGGIIPDMVCTQWLEPSDPHTWNDNYLCAPVDLGLRWSSLGPIPGLRCTPINEPADPHTWADNYLCAP